MLVVSCSEKKPVTSSGGGSNGNESYYRIEIEPSLSFDRSTILMVRADTLLKTLNGIYSAQINNPIRIEEYLGKNITSPTLAVNSKIVAFLQNSRLYIYNKSLDSIYLFPIERSFQKILFINDTLLIGAYHEEIYSLNYPLLDIDTIASGFLPTAYITDTIAYLLADSPSRYLLYLLPISQEPNKNSLANNPIDTIYASRPESFGIEPSMNRYCYSIWNGQEYVIYAGGPGNETDHQVAKSDFSGVVMLDYNRIIYTGDDGRLYQTDFQGSSSVPYWAALDSDN